jgi:hypothetical protein
MRTSSLAARADKKSWGESYPTDRVFFFKKEKIGQVGGDAVFLVAPHR